MMIPVLGLRAMLWLLRARRDYGRLAIEQIFALNISAAQVGRDRAKAVESDQEAIARAAFAIPRTARFMPFRADCLVQALAARNWLLADGIASEIRIGIEQGQETGFGSHAWLTYGEDVVIGGDIGRYVVIMEGSGAR